MKYTFIILILFLSILSCKKDTIENVDRDYLHGKWIQYYNPDFVCFACTNYTLSFMEDSFQMEESYFTDATSVDTCIQKSLLNYSSGKYSIQNRKIEFLGNYTDNTFEYLNTDTCRKKGPYEENTAIYRILDTLFVELNFYSHTDKYYVKFLKE